MPAQAGSVQQLMEHDSEQEAFAIAGPGAESNRLRQSFPNVRMLDQTNTDGARWMPLAIFRLR